MKLRRGFLTIEITWILSFLLLLFLSTVYLGFYLHDRVALSHLSENFLQIAGYYAREPVHADGSLSVERFSRKRLLGREDYVTEEELFILAEEARKTADAALLITRVQTLSIRKEKDGLQIQYEAAADFPLRWLASLAFGEETFHKSRLADVPLASEEIVRFCRGILRRRS